jgi:replication fork clamp-binding protein CrfC
VSQTLPIETLDVALATIAPYRRPDLDARLQQAKVRLLDERVRVLVVGQFKQGKSFLVDCLVGALVCPVHDDVATSVPTVVRHAEQPSVALVRATDATDAGYRSRVEHHDVPITDIARHVAAASAPGERFSHVEVGIPRAILDGGLEIVDTPGVGGFNSVHGAATMSALPSADAVLMVSDASQEYTAPELEFLRQAITICPNVASVITKVDLYPEWRRIAEIDKGHLKAAGIECPMFPVSSAVRWHLVREGRTEFDAESGFPELMRFLRQRVVGQADMLARRSTVNDVLAVTGQLVAGLRSEQSAQRNPEQVHQLIGDLTESQSRSAALKERSARWQQTLNDGVVDLNADIDHDLRDRMRDIVRLAEEEIDGSGDPIKIWDQLSVWAEQQVATAVSANFLWATQRAQWLAEQVAEHFSEDREAALPALHTDASDGLKSVRGMSLRDDERWTIGRKALTGLRGGYGGVLMFGLLGTIVGMSLINPFSIGAGLLMGGRAISDERKRIIARRQSEARRVIRRYVDDATFQVAKDSKDMLRQVQRDLRDHFMGHAEQMNRSLKESLQAAQRSVESSTADRKQRIVEIKSELERLDQLRTQVRTLLPAASRSAAAAPSTSRHSKDSALV